MSNRQPYGYAASTCPKVRPAGVMVLGSRMPRAFDPEAVHVTRKARRPALGARISGSEMLRFEGAG
jgi:hypothetical protein